MVTDKSSSIPSIVRLFYRKTEALSWLLWILPVAIVAVTFLSAHQERIVGRIKFAWLLTECCFFPIFVLVLAGAYFRRREVNPREVNPLEAVHAPGQRKWFPLVVFLVILIPFAFTLDRGMDQGDEDAYLFQARCLNAGALYMSPPASVPVTAIRYDHHLILNGKWFGKYPPGWPLVLSIGTLTRTAWLINPLLAAGLLWLAFQIGSKWLGESGGIACAWILAFSAYYLLNSLGFMSHVFSGLSIAGEVFCCLKFLKSERQPQRRLWIAVALICLVFASTARPFSALCAGLAIVAAMTIQPRWRAIVRWLVCSVLVAGVIFVSMGIQNRLVTGSYFKSPYQSKSVQLEEKEMATSAGEFLHAFRYTTPRRFGDTLSTAFPYLFLLAGFGLWRRRKERFAWMLALILVSLVVGYTVELVDSDSPIGERYFFEGYFALALLGAEGWLQLVKSTQPSALVRRNAIGAVFATSLVITAIGAYWESGWRWPSRQLMQAADHPPAHTDLVFVEAYASIPIWRLNFNKPNSETLFVQDPGPAQRAALAQTAMRPRWICLYYDPVKKAAAWSKAGSESVGSTN